jgi:hypothetical protein
MKAFWAMTAVGVTLLGAAVPAAAQYGYGGGGGPGYGGGGYGGGYGERRRFDDEEEGYGRRRGRSGDYAFDEREYLRCNPDVRRAIVNGQMASGLAHYRTFGRREGRRLSC